MFINFHLQSPAQLLVVSPPSVRMWRLSTLLLGLAAAAWARSYSDQLLPPFTNYLSCGK